MQQTATVEALDSPGTALRQRLCFAQVVVRNPGSTARILASPAMKLN